MQNRVACVFGTFNRRSMLVGAIESVRKNAGVPIDFIIIDGGSTDGSREWLAEQPDVQLLGERGELCGPVRAFNKGFWWTVQHGYELCFHFNDDALLQTPGAVKKAVELLDADPSMGAVAFSFDLFPGKFDYVHSRVYTNFGVLRVSACVEVTEKFGSTRSDWEWWDPCYVSYGADSELGARLWKGGWKIHKAEDIEVKDLQAQDALRRGNEEANLNRRDGKLFWERWNKDDPSTVLPFAHADQIDWKDKKLHLGCGTKRLDGWVNCDGIPTPATDVVADAFIALRVIPAGSLKKIYSSHFVEHVPPDRLPELLALMRSALQPGGVCRIATICFRGIYETRYKEGNLPGALAAMYGETKSSDHPYAAHRQAFDQKSLDALLVGAGFKDVKKWDIKTDAKLMALRDYAVTDKPVTVYSEGIA